MVKDADVFLTNYRQELAQAQDGLRLHRRGQPQDRLRDRDRLRHHRARQGHAGLRLRRRLGPLRHPVHAHRPGHPPATPGRASSTGCRPCRSSAASPRPSTIGSGPARARRWSSTSTTPACGWSAPTSWTRSWGCRSAHRPQQVGQPVLRHLQDQGRPLAAAHRRRPLRRGLRPDGAKFWTRFSRPRPARPGRRSPLPDHRPAGAPQGTQAHARRGVPHPHLRRVGSPAARKNLMYGPILSPLDVIDDPQALANNFFDEIDQPGVGTLRLINQPSGSCRIRRTSIRSTPGLGEHTDEVLSELGYSAEQHRRAERRKVILDRALHARKEAVYVAETKQVLIGENLFDMSERQTASSSRTARHAGTTSSPRRSRVTTRTAWGRTSRTRT